MKSRPRRLLDRAMALPLRRPGAVTLAALVALAFAALALSRMRLDDDVESMLGTEAAHVQACVGELFGWRERSYLLLEADRPGRSAELLACAERLRERLLPTGRFSAVTWRAPLGGSLQSLLFPYGLVLTGDAPALETLLAPDGMRARLEKSAELLSLPGLGAADEMVVRDPLGLELLLAERFATSRGSHRLAVGSPHLLSEDGRALLVVAQANGTNGGSADAAELVATMRRAAAAALADSEGIAFHGTGATWLAEESERIVRRDLTRSLSVSLLLAAALLAVAFRIGVFASLSLCLPTMWGAAVGLGLFVATRERVSALSFGSAAILIGLGIDFTIHVAAAALHARSRGRAPAAAVLRALRETRSRLVVAALTSIAAFLAFTTSPAAFLQDMGWSTAFGLATCLLSPFVVLPPLLVWILRRRPPGRELLPLGGLGAFAVQRPRVTLAAAGLVTAAAIVVLALTPLSIEDDLRNVHARDSAALATQARIAAAFGGSFEPLLVLLRAESEPRVVADAHRLQAQLAPLLQDGTLASALSVAALLPSAAEQRECLQVLRRHDGRRVAEELAAALTQAGFAAEQYQRYVADVARAADVTTPVTVATLREGGHAALVDDLIQSRTDASYALVVLHPQEEPWAGEPRRRLLARVREAIAGAGVAGSVTGLHPVAAEAAAQVAGDFTRVSLLAAAAVVVVLVVWLRRATHVLVVLMPTLLGATWLGGTFAALGMRLNIMNLGVLPMVLGLGVDDGIHMFDRKVVRGRRSVQDVVAATSVPVWLTSLTTIVTFGSLALSDNRGLASVGLLTAIGMAACLVVSLAVVPAVLELLRRHAGNGADTGGTAATPLATPDTAAEHGALSRVP